jgi:hypothetical protein
VQFADSAGKIAVGALKQIPFPFILTELFFIVHEYALKVVGNEKGGGSGSRLLLE